jgi:DNA-binding NarL/FixJ family response regulator
MTDPRPKPGNGISVLVVDDDELLRAAFRRYLIADGFTVLVASGVGEALDTFVYVQIDVLVTDLHLETQRGTDILRALPSISPRTRSILISGNATPEDRDEALKLGASFILGKPVSTTYLVKSILAAHTGSAAP